MTNNYATYLRHKIAVTIFARYALVRNSLPLLLKDDRIRVLNVIETTNNLLLNIAEKEPDVILLCITEEERDVINIIPQLFERAPRTKVLLLADPNGTIDETEALRLGVTGIVGLNQQARVLTRAVKQVFEGETWLNQRLIARLLEKDSPEKNGKSENKKYYRVDDITARELEVIETISLGMTNKDISEKLFISEATVRHHLSSIYSKLCIEDRLNLVIYAYREGLIKPPTGVVNRFDRYQPAKSPTSQSISL